MKIKVIDFGYEKLPLRAHDNDAGADVHVCFHGEDAKRKVEIKPGETKKVPIPDEVVIGIVERFVCDLLDEIIKDLEVEE